MNNKAIKTAQLAAITAAGYSATRNKTFGWDVSYTFTLGWVEFERTAKIIVSRKLTQVVTVDGNQRSFKVALDVARKLFGAENVKHSYSNGFDRFTRA